MFILQLTISARTVVLEALQETLKGRVGCFAIPLREADPAGLRPTGFPLDSELSEVL